MPLKETVLVVDPDPRAREDLATLIEADGCLAIVARDAEEAAERVREAPPHLVLVDAGAGNGRLGLELLRSLRATPSARAVPVTVLVDSDQRETLLEAFDLGADDVVARDTDRRELVARLRARLERPPLPREAHARDPITGALKPEALRRDLQLEVERTARGGSPGCLAYVSLHELPALEAAHGPRARAEVLTQLVALIEADGRRLDLVALSRGTLALLLPGTPAKGGQARLERLSRKIYEHDFSLAGQTVRFTPAIGYCVNEPGLSEDELEDRAWDALMHEAEQLDLHPTHWRSEMSQDPRRADRASRLARWRTPLQVAFQQLLCLGVPLLFYWAMDKLDADVTGSAYIVVVVALAFTAVAIWAECLAALRRAAPPRQARGEYPPATAVIAAYLPNEAETILETVASFLRQDYSELQVILAYNTPHELEVERALRELAREDPRFLPLKIEGSVSKAQNVNAALARVTGRFVGLFDADHHPAPGSFRRAWRWLEQGADVVQGHCVVRNGDSGGLLTRLVAAEFEAIYAVSHPGRARLHGFGIFGGSNGYWRTEVLERIRLRSFMLTEDIDSSLRVLEKGGRIVSDPRLVSTELPPRRWRSLWNQRMRWAQGWSQVSLRHIARSLLTPRLGLRQRLGVFYLLGWRELYPWVSLQTFPILGFWLMRGEPPVTWFVPVFVATTLFTFSAGVAQAWSAWRLAHRSLRRRGRWFLLYFFASQLFYTELKNVMARTAQLKEAMGERKWKVTPRAAGYNEGRAGAVDQLGGGPALRPGADRAAG